MHLGLSQLGLRTYCAIGKSYERSDRQGTTTSNGVSACAYDVETGNKVWCTQKTKIAPPSPTAITPIVASHDDGLVVVGVAGIGLLAVDANPSAA